MRALFRDNLAESLIQWTSDLNGSASSKRFDRSVPEGVIDSNPKDGALSFNMSYNLTNIFN